MLVTPHTFKESISYASGVTSVGNIKKMDVGRGMGIKCTEQQALFHAVKWHFTMHKVALYGNNNDNRFEDS